MVCPSLLFSVLDYRSREMDYGVSAFCENVLDMGVTERAFPDYSAIRLGDNKSVKGSHHGWAKLQVFGGYESQNRHPTKVYSPKSAGIPTETCQRHPRLFPSPMD